MTHETPPIKEVTTFKWRIENFSREAPRTKRWLSTYFKLSDTGADAFLQFNPTNKDTGSKSYSTIYVGSGSFNDQIIETLDFTLWIENTLGKIIAHRSSKETPMNHTHDFYRSYYEFVHHDELYNSDFIKDDTVFICCKIGPKGFVDEEEQTPIEQDFREKALSLYEQGAVGSCSIQLETRTFTVDKIVLMASSPVFERMLTSEMQEAKTGVIKIADVDSSVMDIFIKYLYAGHVQKLDEFAEPLYILADKYEVSGLKAQCTSKLISSLKKDNVLKRLSTAFLYNDGKFKEGLLKYITKPGSDVSVQSLFISDEWCKFFDNNRESAIEIMKAAFDKVNITPKI